ncbi:MAG: aspartate aminotransferase family protein [Rhodospirillales bacterium]|nr:aspartate aminotransferase family protein [Rhodospirillales bacterium]
MTLAPNSLAARDVAYTLHPYTNLAAHEERGPLIMSRAEGIHIYDEEGNKYIEGLAGLWCTGLGYSQKRLVEAAKRQMETLPFSHFFAHRSMEPTIELAEKLISIAPKGMAKAFFVNSGSEAVDSAIKFCWYYNNARGRPKKKKIISRTRAYHGVTVASGSLTALAYAQEGWDLPLDRFLHCGTPYHYRYGKEGESEEDFATRLADELDRQIIAEGPETVAAFFAEPVMGAGGVLVPPATYFGKIQAILQKHDVLLVADEVICGFGRTGNMWGSESFGMVPDMMTFAKQLSSAYIPIGGIMISDEIYQTFVEHSNKLGIFGTGNTYGGHPVAAAVALETLKIYEDEDILGHVRSVMGLFQDRLKALGEHPLIGDARGVGLIGGLEIVKNKATKEQFPPETKAAQKAYDAIFAHGLILRPLPGDAIGVCPPLIVTEDEINDIFDRTRRGLDDLMDELKPGGMTPPPDFLKK